MKITVDELSVAPTGDCVELSGFSFARQVRNDDTSILVGSIAILHGPQTLIFGSFDTFLLSDAFGKKVHHALQQNGISVPFENMLFYPTHIHTGGTLDDRILAINYPDQAYIESTIQKVVESITEQFSRAGRLAEGCEVQYVAAGINELIANRRSRQWIGVRKMAPKLHDFNAPNLAINAFNDLQMFAILDANGASKAIIWSLAAHATTFQGLREISPHYVGLVRAHLKREFADVVVLYLPGFAGDQVLVQSSNFSWKMRLKSWLKLPLQWSATSQDSVLEISNRLIEQLPVLEASKPKMVAEVKSSLTTIVIGRKMVSKDWSDLSLTIRLARIGQIFVLGFSSEPLAGWVEKIRKITPKGFKIICTGYTDTTFGYLPTETSRNDTSYELVESVNLYGMNKIQLATDFESKIIEEVKNLIAAAL